MNNFPYYNEKNNRGRQNPPREKHFDFKCCKDNTIKSLYEVEHFLNKLQHNFKYFKLYKLLK